MQTNASKAKVPMWLHWAVTQITVEACVYFGMKKGNLQWDQSNALNLAYILETALNDEEVVLTTVTLASSASLLQLFQFINSGAGAGINVRKKFWASCTAASLGSCISTQMHLYIPLGSRPEQRCWYTEPLVTPLSSSKWKSVMGESNAQTSKHKRAVTDTKNRANSWDTCIWSVILRSLINNCTAVLTGKERDVAHQEDLSASLRLVWVTDSGSTASDP